MWRKLLFFSLLYFVQGAALAYVVNFQKPYLSGQGISKETLGIFTSLLLIPFIGKVFLGYLSDRFPIGRWGGRKPYMLLGLGIFASCYFTLAHISPETEFLTFAILTWLASLGLAWFDTCADGWAVDVASENEQSRIQAAMIAGKSAGLILMSGAFGVLALQFGFSVIFKVMASLAFIIALIVALVPHRGRSQSEHVFVQDWRGLFQTFYVFFAIYAVVYSIASFGTDGLMTLHLSEVHHASAFRIGIFGMWRGLGALLGAIGFGIFSSKFGLKRAQQLALIVLGGACLLPLSGWADKDVAVLWGIAWGFQETAFVTLAMRFAQGRWAATLFAGSMIFSNLGTSIGEALGSPLVPQMGFNGVFVMFAVLAWSSQIFLPQVFKPIKED